MTAHAALSDPGRLRALAATGLLDDVENEAFARLTRLVRVCLRVPVALVSLVTDRREVVRGQRGLAGPWASVGEAPLSHSLGQHVVACGVPVRIGNAREAPRLRGNLAVRDLGVAAYFGMPIRTPDGHVVGALSAIAGAPRAWTDADAEVLEALAEAAAAEVSARLRPGGEPARDADGRQAALFRALFTRGAQPAFVVDATGGVLDANPAALAGRPRRDVVGRALAVVAPHAVADLWEVAGTDLFLSTEAAG